MDEIWDVIESVSEGFLTYSYVYNSLPFGLATAGHIFSKVLRAVVTFWRSKGHTVITFSDDGLGGDIVMKEPYSLVVSSEKAFKTSVSNWQIKKFVWLPKLQITWLGYLYA